MHRTTVQRTLACVCSVANDNMAGERRAMKDERLMQRIREVQEPGEEGMEPFRATYQKTYDYAFARPLIRQHIGAGS